MYASDYKIQGRVFLRYAEMRRRQPPQDAQGWDFPKTFANGHNFTLQNVEFSGFEKSKS